ncbi:MAG: phosphotransferase enzyme family protein [Carbonactinosporaceae bacterium]
MLEDACAHSGLDICGAKLLRLGENALFVLATSPIVVRIARGEHLLPDVEKEVCVAHWLRREGMPAARLAELPSTPQPLLVRGRPVTFWQFIDARAERPPVRELGRILRQLHGLEQPEDVPLRELDPFGRIERRLKAVPSSVPSDAVRFLTKRFHVLRERYQDVSFELSRGPVHGDAHTGNLLRTRSDGEVLLIDFEMFAYGPREWDLAVPAGYYQGLNWISREEYETFVAAYGYDVIESPSFPVLRAIRELSMTVWLMQLVDDRPQAAAEFSRRVSDLRNESVERHWTPM